MGTILKGLALGGVAAAKVKYYLIVGESPAEAFRRVYNDVVKSGEATTEIQVRMVKKLLKSLQQTYKVMW